MPRNFGEDKIITNAKVLPTLDARMGTGGEQYPSPLMLQKKERTDNTRIKPKPCNDYR